jgi:hypothetical protein
MLATLSNRLCALNKARHAYNAQLPVERVYLVALETQEQRLEREQNACDVLEALSDYKCDAGMSVENVPAVVNIKTLKRRFIARKFSTGWAVVKSVPHTEELAGRFGFKCNRQLRGGLIQATTQLAKARSGGRIQEEIRG